MLWSSIILVLIAAEDPRASSPPVQEPTKTEAREKSLKGYILHDGAWVSPDEAVKRMGGDTVLARTVSEYQAKRDGVKERAEDHAALGIWCESNGLKGPAKAHFITALRLNPHLETAWKHLGFRKRGGAWVSDEQLAAERAEKERQAEADRKWLPLLKRYKTLLGGRDKARRAEAEAGLAQVDDPRAAVAIWSVFGIGPPASQEVAVRLLDALDGDRATRVLAALVVFARSDDVARKAIDALKSRDVRGVIPYFIENLRDPIKYEVRPGTTPGAPSFLSVEGEINNWERLYQPGPFLVEAVPSRVFTFDAPLITNPGPLGLLNPGGPVAQGRGPVGVGGEGPPGTPSLNDQLIRAGIRRDQEIAEKTARNNQAAAFSSALAAQRMAKDVQLIENVNENRRAVNARVVRALKAVTGEDRGDDLAAWRIRFSVATDGRYRRTPEPEGPRRTLAFGGPLDGCVAAKTLVFTMMGRKPAERIKIGDEVLSQDTTTGRLSFQPVVGIRELPAAPVLTLRFQDESLNVTAVQRLWKAGKGWVRARELKVGDRVRVLGGTRELTGVSEEEARSVVGLELSDHQAVLIGNSGVLSKDDSAFDPSGKPFDAPEKPALGKSN